jgi:hypothetical protein
MHDIEAMLLRTLGAMPPDRRMLMLEFIQLVAARDPRALRVVRQIESGMLAPTDAFTALDACLQSRH